MRLLTHFRCCHRTFLFVSSWEVQGMRLKWRRWRSASRFWSGEWQMDQLWPSFYRRTGSIESEIIHLHINIYGSRSLSSTMYFWNIVYKENIDSPIIPL